MIDYPVNILMYHSISPGPPPICIAPPIFQEQMAILSECGYEAVSVGQYASWRRGELKLRPPFVVLTFDDGYRDFAATALPVICARGWRCTTFLPAGKIGARSDWMREACRVPLMDWKTVSSLSSFGVELGAHGIDHLDLTLLPLAAAHAEVGGSKQLIEDHTGQAVTSFAAPYGKSSVRIRQVIRDNYTAAVGTEFAPALLDRDIYDLPRIEMWYFRNPEHWRQYLRIGNTGYYRWRRAVRRTRGLLSRLLRARASD